MSRRSGYRFADKDMRQDTPLALAAGILYKAGLPTGFAHFRAPGAGLV
jgi:hypothetical protein